MKKNCLQLSRNALAFLSTVVIRGVGALSLLLLAVVVTNSVGLDNAGIFFFSQAVFLFCATICKWGADIVLCRYLASDCDQQSSALILSYTTSTIFLVFTRYAVVVFVLVFLGEYIFLDYSKIWALNFNAALLANSIILSLAGIFQAFRAINTYVLYQSVLIPLLSSIGIWFFDVSTMNGLWQLIMIVSLLVLMAMILQLSPMFLKSRKILGSSRKLFDLNLTKYLSKKAKNIGADQIVTSLSKHGYIFVIGFFMASTDVTFFTVSQRFAMTISFVLLVINAISGPIYANLIENENYKELINTFYENVKICLGGALVIFVFILFFSGLFSDIGNLPKDTFIYLFVLLSLGEIINVATGSSVLVLQMSDRSRLVLISSLVFNGIGICFALLASQQSVFLVACCVAAAVAGHNLNCYRVFRRISLIESSSADMISNGKAR